MDCPVLEPSDFSSMDDESHHQYGCPDAAAEDALGDEDNRDVDGTDRSDHQLPWYYQPQFSRFWHHYSAMQSWMQMYITMHQNRSPQYASLGYPQMVNKSENCPHCSTSYRHGHHLFSERTYSPFPNWNLQSQRTANQYGSASPHYHNSASQAANYEDSNEAIDDSDEDSMEMEISQEMMEFFKTSKKFREERDRAKAEAEKKSSDSRKRRKNPMREDEKDDCRAPVEGPDEGRRREMKVLYGKHSARIHSMETAMQMQFDRNCDRFQPAFWPIVALKM